MLSEFDLIRQYFTRPPRATGLVQLGVGDDCALLTPAAGMQLAISTDMLVEGRHFLPAADARTLAHKCLAVNLSDLAAMGARPLAFTLAFSLPEANPDWLAAFSQGLFALADAHGCELIGGDTTKGPLTICITVFGEVPSGAALRRDGAKAGDDIWVSGSLGDARLALAAYRHELSLPAGEFAQAAERMHQPSPRIALGLALRGIANAAIDISDGLSGDLGHILQRSGVGATLMLASLPAGPMLSLQAPALQQRFALTGGDDYELCFTAPVDQREAVLAAGRQTHTPVTRIGRIHALETGVETRLEIGSERLALVDIDGTASTLALDTFDHFRSP